MGYLCGADLDLRVLIRDRLERGALSLAFRCIAARRSDGDVCIVCERMITPTEIANRSLSADGRTVWTHVDCLRLWHEEAMACEVRHIEQERGSRAELCATVRGGFADGSIPVLPHQPSRFSRGVKGHCTVCRKLIARNEMAYEVVGGVPGRAACAHPICYRVWRIESILLRRLPRVSRALGPKWQQNRPCPRKMNYEQKYFFVSDHELSLSPPCRPTRFATA